MTAVNTSEEITISLLRSLKRLDLRPASTHIFPDNFESIDLEDPHAVVSPRLHKLLKVAIHFGIDRSSRQSPASIVFSRTYSLASPWPT